jgi:predicted CopG family antitoxin
MLLGEKVEISTEKYEELVLAKARNRVLEDMVLRRRYIDKKDVASVLGIDVPKEEEEE